MKSVVPALAALVIVASSCADGRPGRIPWPGSVQAEVDDLTGARTGMFRTFGPTQLLTAGRDTIPVTLGYWCQVNEDSEPLSATDGVFFEVAMPDTSLTSSDEAAFEELSGQLGLLDVARMAVDGRVYAWQYRATPTHGGWFLDGTMGFQPLPELDTDTERDEMLRSTRGSYETLAEVDEALEERPRNRVAGLVQERLRSAAQGLGDLLNEREVLVREGWSPAHDYVTSHYVGRDTLGIELKGVLTFPMEGFAAATDSVRFWCPVVQSHHEWNAVRLEFLGAWDGLRSSG